MDKPAQDEVDLIDGQVLQVVDGLEQAAGQVDVGDAAVGFDVGLQAGEDGGEVVLLLFEGLDLAAIGALLVEVVGIHDEVHKAADFLAVDAQTGAQFAGLLFDIFDRPLALFAEVVPENFLDIGGEEVIFDGLEDLGLEFDAGDGAGGALAEVAFGAAAGVIGIGFFAAKADLVAVHGGVAFAAVEQAAEEVGGVEAAGMVERFGFGFDAAAVRAGQILDGVPGGAIDEGFAVVLEDAAAEVQLADVEGVGEKAGVGVFGVVEAGFGVDAGIGFAGGAHLPGPAALVPAVRVGHPAVDDVGGAVAAAAEGDGLAFETDRRQAAQGAVFGHQVAEAALDVLAQVHQEFLVHPIGGSLEKTAVETGGDGIVEGMDDEAAAAEVGLEKHGVVDIAGETGEFPHDQPVCSDPWRFEMRNCGAKLFAAHHRRSWSGAIGEDVGEDEAVLGAPPAQGVFLLFDGKILIFPA